jgi:hypothetical protein
MGERTTRIYRPPVPASALLTWVGVAGVLVAAAGLSQAQVVRVPREPIVGSSNPATPAPGVPRPDTKPCVVSLLQDQAFENFTPAPLNFTPPATCPGPWAKVVLTADFTVSAGIQYDRTAYFYLGGANIFYGTTAEPDPTLSPAWHVERDVTDLSSVFATPQTGAAFAGNIVNSTYTGIIYANAALEFYPAAASAAAPPVPDVVVPVSANNAPITLNTGSDQATASVSLPRNTERVFLDVISQSQIDDEFWYLCVPNDVAGELESCGNTAFRETEISIDGTPAGVAPVYPWIFTGGIDPYLWQPIVGVQTLDLRPYRVDLTPFAGLLGDGATHTLAISVFNADSYFLATANLLVFLDHGAGVVAGGLLSDTLSAQPNPQVTENLTTGPSGAVYGTVSVGSDRKFSISGYVQTSHGRVETTVQETVHFLSLQKFDVSAAKDVQSALQTSTVDAITTTQSGAVIEVAAKHSSFPLALNYSYVVHADGTSTQTTGLEQGYHLQGGQALPAFSDEVHEVVRSKDIWNFDSSGNPTGPGDDTAAASYLTTDSHGTCFSRALTAANGVLTTVSNGTDCQKK